MDLQTLIRIVLRRWMIVLPLIAVIVLAGQRVVSTIEPKYEASGSMLLLPPSQPAPPPTVKAKRLAATAP